MQSVARFFELRIVSRILLYLRHITEGLFMKQDG